MKNGSLAVPDLAREAVLVREAPEAVDALLALGEDLLARAEEDHLAHREVPQATEGRGMFFAR